MISNAVEDHDQIPRVKTKFNFKFSFLFPFEFGVITDSDFLNQKNEKFNEMNELQKCPISNI